MKLMVEKSMDWTENSSQLKDVSRVPKSIARRASQISVQSLEVALALMEGASIDYAIFSSQHGELSHTLNLLESLAKNETLSPSEFSQSVHNTVSGLATIISKTMTKATSIAAGSRTREMAFVEAVGYLNENPNSRILWVHFDENLPDFYLEKGQSRQGSFVNGKILRNIDEHHSLPMISYAGGTLIE